MTTFKNTDEEALGRIIIINIISRCSPYPQERREEDSNNNFLGLRRFLDDWWALTTFFFFRGVVRHVGAKRAFSNNEAASMVWILVTFEVVVI